MNQPPRGRGRPKTDRSKRIPLGTHRYKLSAPQRTGYMRRWVNDRPGRLQQFTEAGYEFVNDPSIQVGQNAEAGHNDLGSRISAQVGVNEGGSPLRAYLMEIKKEWYDEDQAVKKLHNDEIDRQIRGGSLEGEPGQDGRYIPSDGIKYDIS